MKLALVFVCAVILFFGALVSAQRDPEVEARVRSVVDMDRDPVSYWFSVFSLVDTFTNTSPFLTSPNAVLYTSVVYRTLDRLGCFRGRFRSFRCSEDAVAAGVTVSAHYTINQLYPGFNRFMTSYTTPYYAQIPASHARDFGARIGRETAMHVLGRGMLDGRGEYVFFSEPQGEGLWQPTPPAFNPYVGAYLANMTHYALSDSEEVPPPQPPSLCSETFLTSLNETRTLGEKESTQRTTYGTVLAEAFNGMGPQVLLGLLKLAHDEGYDQFQTATFLRVVVNSGYETHVLSHYWKVVHLTTRPISIIRNGLPSYCPDAVRNNFQADPTWESLGVAAANAEYPCGTCSLVAGYLLAAKKLLGSNDRTFNFVVPLENSVVDIPVPLTFNTLNDAIDAVVFGRITRGIHFRHSGEASIAQSDEASTLIVQRMCPRGRCLDEHRPRVISRRFL